MRTIYVFKTTIDNSNLFRTARGGLYGRPRGWLDSHNWYRAGVILGYILQFIAGIGIGWFVKAVLLTLGIV